MDVTVFKKSTDGGCDLTFKVIHDHECWFSVTYQLSNSLHIRNDDIVDVSDHGLLSRPVFGRVGDVPSRRKLELWMAAGSFSLVDGTSSMVNLLRL